MRWEDERRHPGPRLRQRRHFAYAKALPLLAICAATLAASGCGLFRRSPGGTGPGAVQVGTASWYGPGFHGKRTSTGEVYDQNGLTAAHNSYPLGTRIMVTNLDNGRQVKVRINDRGPFVGDRILDLSYGAGSALGMIANGLAHVRIEVLDGQPLQTLFAVQVGAFADRDAARELQDRLAERFDEVHVARVTNTGGTYYRVRVGPFDDRAAAGEAARKVSSLGLSPLVVEDGDAP